MIQGNNAAARNAQQASAIPFLSLSGNQEEKEAGEQERLNRSLPSLAGARARGERTQVW